MDRYNASIICLSVFAMIFISVMAYPILYMFSNGVGDEGVEEVFTITNKSVEFGKPCDYVINGEWMVDCTSDQFNAIELNKSYLTKLYSWYSLDSLFPPKKYYYLKIVGEVDKR